MNAEEFYDEFKRALRVLGPGWFDKHLVKIKAKRGRFVLSYGGVKISISTETKAEK